MYIGKIETGRSYKKILILFLVITFLLIAFVIYVSFSHAKITIKPKLEIASIDFKVDLEENPELFSKLNVIRARLLDETLEETRHISDVPKVGIDQKAKGKVIIYNKRGESQGLLPRTQLLSKEGILFRTDEAVNVPAYGQVEVGVHASEPGKQGEIGPSSFIIVKLWQAWQSLIYAESKEPMREGYREAHMVTQALIDTTKDRFAQDLFNKILSQTKEKIEPNEAILEDAMEKEILEVKSSVKPNTETSEFDLKLKVYARMLIFDRQGLFNLALAHLKDSISSDKEFLYDIPESFKYTTEESDLDRVKAKILCHLEAGIAPKLSSQIFDKERLVGKDAQEVKEYFKQFTDIAEVEVQFWPFWVKSVPLLKDRIEIIVSK